jgi:topoisomerase-4 subunit A
MVKNKKELWTLELDEFIEVKGWKAMGNRLSTKQIRGIRIISAENEADATAGKYKSDGDTSGLKAGDTIELDL